MPLELNDYNLILMELNKAVKMHNFYPQGHPNLQNALKHSHKVMQEKMVGEDELKFTLNKKNFLHEQTPINPDNADLAALAKRLFYRRIKEFTITTQVTIKDLSYLLDTIHLEPDDITAKGGVESILASHGVEGVLLNEMRYEDLKRLKAQLEEKAAEEEAEKALALEAAEAEAEEGEEGGPGAGGEEQEHGAKGELSTTVEGGELGEGEADAVKVDEQLQELLEKIDVESDFLKYNDLSAKINEQVESLIAAQCFGEAFSALLLFLDHSGASRLDPDIRTIAVERLDQFLANNEVLKYLVERVGHKEEANRNEIQKMIIKRGDTAIELLLNVLVEAREASTRRNLFNTAIQFGDTVLPHIDRELKNDTWYAVRQMVALIGEIGDPSTIDMLQKSYLHEDIRVKREVLKSMARIASERSTQFLIDALEESDESLVNQAITSLGMLRDPAAIDKLGEIALHWETFADTQEAKREAVKALGIIGDQRAVKYLTKILFKKRWFGKHSNEEFRALAANALGMIGGEESFNAIEKAHLNSEGDLYNTCKRILDGREKKA